MLTGTKGHSRIAGHDGFAAPRGRHVAIAGLIALGACAVVHLAWLGGDPYYNNDESRHLMTGAFLCDLFTELPYDDPLGFAKRYYVQYPNLGILVSPPLFHVLEGGVFCLFGVSAASAKLLMGAFAAVFFAGWWFWVREYVGVAVATWSTVLTALVHDVFELSGHAMLEIPFLAWMVVTVIAFRAYLRTHRALWLWAACGAATGVALTRFHAPIVLGPLLMLMAVSRQWGLLRRRSFWLPVLLAATVSGAYCYINVRYYHTWHSIWAAEGGFGRVDLLIREVVKSLGTVPTVVAVLGVAGFVIVPLLRRRVPLPPVAWLAAAVLMWFLVTYRPTRFLVYAWPAAVTLGVYTLFVVVDRCGVRRLGHVMASVAVCLAAWELHASYRPGVEGYGQAAAQAMAASDTRRVFMHGRQDGVFIWNVRQRDPGLAYTVFRASKFLSSGEPAAMNDFRTLIGSDEQILAGLDALGVDVVVSEDLPEIDAPPYHAFMRLLASDRFEPIGAVDVRNHQGRTFARRLTLYRFLRRPVASDEISIPLTALGPDYEVRVNLRRPLRGWRRHDGNEAGEAAATMDAAGSHVSAADPTEMGGVP